jgi:hypothetical protein
MKERSVGRTGRIAWQKGRVLFLAAATLQSRAPFVLARSSLMMVYSSACLQCTSNESETYPCRNLPLQKPPLLQSDKLVLAEIFVLQSLVDRVRERLPKAKNNCSSRNYSIPTLQVIGTPDRTPIWGNCLFSLRNPWWDWFRRYGEVGWWSHIGQNCCVALLSDWPGGASLRRCRLRFA